MIVNQHEIINKKNGRREEGGKNVKFQNFTVTIVLVPWSLPELPDYGNDL